MTKPAHSRRPGRRRPRRGHPSIRLTAVALFIGLCVLISFAATRAQQAQTSTVRILTPIALPPKPTPKPTLQPAPLMADLANTITNVEVTFHVRIGLSLAPIAAPGKVTTAPWYGGALPTTPAWQTFDVPIAWAASQNANQSTDINYLLHKALAQNSSAASDALWQLLGPPEQAAATTLAVLAATGDKTTTIPVDQTTGVPSDVWWTQANAAQFMGVLYCTNQSWPVLSQMNRDSNQYFGLASLNMARVRTGSGTDPTLSPGTVFRQVGLLTLADHSQVGVSLAAAAYDGSTSTVKAAMTAVAKALPPVTGLPGYC